MTRSKHRYHQLADTSFIRLLTILPKNNKDGKVLRLKLAQVSLDNVSGQYEAISYMWGPEEPSRHVLVNGKALQIRENIWRCLKHVRDRKITQSRLWIDTICINQADEKEKNQQVAMMRRTFEHASRVLVWLGSTSMQTYLNVLEGSIEALPPDSLDTWFDALGHSDARRWSLVNQLMSITYNLYWYRLWIVQELVVARDVCIIFGDSLLSNTFLSPIYLTAREISKPGYRWWIDRQTDPNFEEVGTWLLEHHPILDATNRVGKLKSLRRPMTFAELIDTYQWQFCSDPRDYVYGLLGLVDSHTEIEVDYGLSNEEVALQALRLLDRELNSSDRLVYLTTATALLRNLKVTGESYARFMQTLPSAQAKSLYEPVSRIMFYPWAALVAVDEDERADDERASNDLEKLCQLPVSGHLHKTLQVSNPPEMTYAMIKLLNGHIRCFAYKQYQPPATGVTKSDIFYFCMLPFMILRQIPGEKGQIVIEHFFRTPNDSAAESTPWIEISASEAVRNSVQREINASSVTCDDILRDSRVRPYLQFSTYETIRLCEMIAPHRIDHIEFWKNSCKGW